MVKDHSAREETRCRHVDFYFLLSARVILYRQDNTYHGPCGTSRGALSGTRNSFRRMSEHCSRTLCSWSGDELILGRFFRVGLILHGVDPLSYFSFQPVLHNGCNKGRGMCYPVCGMVHIKETLLLIGKSSLCGGNGFPFSLSEWSLTICLTLYNRK